MDWIKVTPETMPPDMERLIVTMIIDGEKMTIGNVRYRGECWEIEEFLIHKWLYIKPELITHWMLMPAPAEDELHDNILTPHLIDITTSRDLDVGHCLGGSIKCIC